MSRVQLKNMMYRKKAKLEDGGPADLSEVKEWCQQREPPSDTTNLDPHEVVVPFSNCLDPKKLYICLTTKNLVRISAEADFVMTDATYKMNIHGFPVILTGHQDANRHFHQTGLHIVWEEESSDVYQEVVSFSNAFCLLYVRFSFRVLCL